MKIVIGSDHGGFELKQQLIPFVQGMGHAVFDVGCFSDASIDYPDVAFPLAEAVARGEYDRGIIICGTGIGVSICCNRIGGVRCALCGDVVSAELTRRHNDSNVLALGGRIVGLELAKGIVLAWLTTDFEGGRHQRRIDKIDQWANIS